MENQGMENVAFKRLQIDVPPDVAHKLKQLALDMGMAQKRLVAQLIQDAVAAHEKPKHPVGGRRRGKEKGKG